VEYNCKDIL